MIPIKYDAFIVAGGKAPWLQAEYGTQCRALVQLEGKRMVDYVLEALLDSGRIERVVIAVDAEFLPKLEGTLPPNVSLCAAGTDLSSSTVLATKELGLTSNKILGVCDDIPFITAEAVTHFLDQCQLYPDAELYYPIIPKEDCLSSFPNAKRTYATLADGTFTGGNMMLMSKELINKAQELAKEIFVRRKSPLKLCSWLGWSFILKLLLHILTIKGLEKRLSQLFNTRCKAIITPYAAIGMDMDKPADLALAQKLLRKEHAYGQSQKN